MLEETARLSKALLIAWLPGREGAAAVRELLFGDENPSGKLSMSFPYSASQKPIWYSDLRNGRMRQEFPSARYVSGYLDCPDRPLYPFGFGLSYTRFAYGTPEIRGDIDRDGFVTVRCTVTNCGSRAGMETVQLYLQDPVSSVIRPERELKGFRRLFLSPGETKIAEFRLDFPALSLIDFKGNRVVEPGAFRVLVGGKRHGIFLPHGKGAFKVEYRLTKSIPLIGDYDVLVAGGGPAGCAAAMAAAQQGAKVLLLEQAFMLGGAATAGLVNAWTPFSDGVRVTYGGIAQEVFRRTKAQMYHIPKDALNWVSIDPEALKSVYDRMAAEAGVPLRQLPGRGGAGSAGNGRMPAGQQQGRTYGL